MDAPKKILARAKFGPGHRRGRYALKWRMPIVRPRLTDYDGRAPEADKAEILRSA